MAAFASSYIKTEASQVTRSADSATMTGANFLDWWNPSEGTMYAEANGLSQTSAGGKSVFEIGSGLSSGTDRIGVLILVRGH